MKNLGVIFPFLLFMLTGLFTVYSFVFPFEAGEKLQGVWVVMIVFLSPLGLVLAITNKGNTQPKLKKVAIGGNVALMLFLFLYMTLGVIVLGV
ncbi:hypothetical protein [Paenibacillus sp. P32E]|uniref:hypothetical protein n=1 Tax=Paenibacillus sp. P32E TaxID=1349434 RepID=UPI0009649F68|nr:hypothetical protein [Paenibacillus sp. P32E]OKP89883.1 hypothetical protein A3848_14000 [Paenibacillus sp. P32E]